MKLFCNCQNFCPTNISLIFRILFFFLVLVGMVNILVVEVCLLDQKKKKSVPYFLNAYNNLLKLVSWWNLFGLVFMDLAKENYVISVLFFCFIVGCRSKPSWSSSKKVLEEFSLWVVAKLLGFKLCPFQKQNKQKKKIKNRTEIFKLSQRNTSI